jgi:hypothetical protein
MALDGTELILSPKIFQHLNLHIFLCIRLNNFRHKIGIIEDRLKDYKYDMQILLLSDWVSDSHNGHYEEYSLLGDVTPCRPLRFLFCFLLLLGIVFCHDVGGSMAFLNFDLRRQ